MNIEKIEVNGHYVYVDKDAEIKEGDWMIRPNENPVLVTPNFWWDFGIKYHKIIAVSPELNLDGVPSYVEFLIEQYKNRQDIWKKMFNDGYQTKEKELQKQLITEIMNEDAKDGLYEPQPTWDDVAKAITMARETEYGLAKGKDEIIEYLKQFKQEKK